MYCKLSLYRPHAEDAGDWVHLGYWLPSSGPAVIRDGQFSSGGQVTELRNSNVVGQSLRDFVAAYRQLGYEPDGDWDDGYNPHNVVSAIRAQAILDEYLSQGGVR